MGYNTCVGVASSASRTFPPTISSQNNCFSSYIPLYIPLYIPPYTSHVHPSYTPLIQYPLSLHRQAGLPGQAGLPRHPVTLPPTPTAATTSSFETAPTATAAGCHGSICRHVGKPTQGCCARLPTLTNSSSRLVWIRRCVGWGGGWGGVVMGCCC